MEDNRFYVYCHCKKTDGKCFYVGKGCKYRYSDTNGRNLHWNNIVNKHGFTWEILINNISEEKAFELESIICNQIGYENLCNLNQEKGNSGWTISEEQSKQRSLVRKGKPKPEGFGEQHSKKMLGKIKPEGTGDKISKSLTGYIHTKERNNNISKSLTGKFKSESHKQNMRKPKPEGFSEKIKEIRQNTTWKPSVEQIEASIQAKNKCIEQLDKEGNILNEYISIKIGAKAICVNRNTLSSHLRGKYKTCMGFIFRYKI